MTLGEFDGLVLAVARRLRLARAQMIVWKPIAALLVVLSVVVLVVKLVPVGNPAFLGYVLLLSAGLAAGGSLLAVWLALPMSTLCAAAEIDRVANLKERGASVVAARCGAAPKTAAFAAMEADLAAALAGVSHEQVLRGLLPALPARAKWLAALMAAFLGAVLAPARGAANQPSLATMLASGSAVSAAAQSALSGGEDRLPPTAYRHLVVLLKTPPPDNPETAAKQKGSLEAIAAELRKSGSAADRALAEAVEGLARELALLAGAPPDAAASEGGAPAAAASAGEGRYPEYAELLARYFGPQ